MSYSKRKKYVKKSFESDGSESDTSANIYQSMMHSLAWKALTANQKVLLLSCKGEYYGLKHKPQLLDMDEQDSKNTDNSLLFFMNKSKWAKKKVNSNSKMKSYELYDENNGAGFIRDMTALIEKGFVACVFSGAISRTKSIYRFVDTWKKYGTKEFSVNHQDKTLAMQGYRKRNGKSNSNSPITDNY